MVCLSWMKMGVAKIPVGSNSALGVFKTGAYGISVASSSGAAGTLIISKSNNAEIEGKDNAYKPIVPANLDKAIMEGLGNYNLGTDNVNARSDAYKAHARQVIGAQNITIQILEEGDN